MSGPFGSSQWMYASGDYEIDNSVRFNHPDAPHMKRTPSSAGNRRTFTMSMWYKPSIVVSSDSNPQLFSVGDTGERPSAALTHLTQGLNGALAFEEYDGSGYNYQIKTNAILRDPSAWYHIMVAVDTTQGTNTNRIKIYINGEQQTSLHTSSWPDQNLDTAWNNTKAHGISTLTYNSVGDADSIDGYLAEFNHVDGQQLTPASFGKTDNTFGHWKPIEYGGTYGTNGFYLNFKGGGIIAANGGTITTDGDYKVHTFTSDGTFTPTSVSGDGYVEYLVIAGGGGGGRGAEYNSVNAGGGAGGYLTGMYQVTQGTDYAIVVGGGGDGSTYNKDSSPWGVIGDNGDNSTAFGLTAIGGGLGGSYNSKGSDGGSGGGTGLRSSGQDLTGGAATAGQGNAGGSGTLFGGTGTANSGGGGGGAGAVGGNGSGGTGGAGGVGLASSITGSSVTRAGGGGGGARSTGGAGGSGGGGAGAGGNGAGGDGSANTGGGGGGGASSHPDSNVNNHTGGDGGSGIVIVRFKFQ